MFCLFGCAWAPLGPQFFSPFWFTLRRFFALSLWCSLNLLPLMKTKCENILVGGCLFPLPYFPPLPSCVRAFFPSFASSPFSFSRQRAWEFQTQSTVSDPPRWWVSLRFEGSLPVYYKSLVFPFHFASHLSPSSDLRSHIHLHDLSEQGDLFILIRM